MADERQEAETWENVFETMESFRNDLEMQSTNANLTYHEGALLLNRLETAVNILRSLTDLCGVGSPAEPMNDVPMYQHEDTERVYNLSIVQELCELFNQIHVFWANKVVDMQRNTITLPDFGARETNQTGNVGRPSFVLPKAIIENLRASGFYTWKEIARMLQVSRWTIYRRVREYGLENLGRFTKTTDDDVVGSLVSRSQVNDDFAVV